MPKKTEKHPSVAPPKSSAPNTPEPPKNPDPSTVRIWVNRRGLSSFLGRDLAIGADVREFKSA